MADLDDLCNYVNRGASLLHLTLCNNLETSRGAGECVCVCVCGGGGGGGGKRGINIGAILVRVSEPVFQNLPHSYTWLLEKWAHSYT